jgi:hypothetical protein
MTISPDETASNSTDILWLLVAYRNMAEVDRYIEQLDALRSEGTGYRYAVCDNSPASKVSVHAARPDVVTVARPDNPGYLDGGLEALRAAVVAGWADASWICLGNTDLVWQSGDPVRSLAAHDADIAQIVAPRITENATGIERNPHMLERRSTARMRANRLIAASTATTYAYLAAVATKERLRTRSVPTPTTTTASSRSGKRFYSAYGALIFFSRAFRPDVNLPAGVPLLSEEYYIAEVAAEMRAPVTYDDTIHVVHDSHSTTGSAVTWRRARTLRRAFREMHADAARRRAV